MRIKLFSWGEKKRNIHLAAWVTTFVDFEKAFDLIDREVLFLTLRNSGVWGSSAKAIKILHTDARSAILVDGQLSQDFPVKSGVLRGAILTLFLFIIVTR